MSELERRKATIVLVKDAEGNPVNIFNYIYMKYGIDIVEDVPESAVFYVLCSHLEYENIDEKYYWFDGKLYKELSSKDIDPSYHTEAHFVNNSCITLDCTWYNGGGSFQEVAEVALKELEERLKSYE